MSLHVCTAIHWTLWLDSEKSTVTQNYDNACISKKGNASIRVCCNARICISLFAAQNRGTGKGICSDNTIGVCECMREGGLPNPVESVLDGAPPLQERRRSGTKRHLEI